jgi:putative hydrolase of the HAD superfamily
MRSSPTTFHHTVGLMGVDADEALMIGDSLPNDVLGARAAGLMAVLVDRADVHGTTDVPRVRSLHDLDFTA